MESEVKMEVEDFSSSEVTKHAANGVENEIEESAACNFMAPIAFAGTFRRTTIMATESDDENPLLLEVKTEPQEDWPTFNDYHKSHVQEGCDEDGQLHLLPKEEGTEQQTSSGHLKTEDVKEEDDLNLPIIKEEQFKEESTSAPLLGLCKRKIVVEDEETVNVQLMKKKEIENAIFDSEEQFMEAQNSQRNMHLCGFCHESFTQSRDLQKHLITHTGEKPYTCEVCQKSFVRSERLNEHMKTHTGEKPYTCKVCQRSFIHSRNLHRHFRTHTGEITYTCKVCQKSFVRSERLNEHMKTHTVKPYTCKVCQKSFVLLERLNEHMKTHTVVKPYTCKVCQKSFTQSISLNVHMRTHTGEKPYTCKVCQKSFTQPKNLNRHLMEQHKSTQPWVCEVCQTSFIRSIELMKHMRTHTGEKPYTCKVCQQFFTQSGDLLRHLMRTHTGVKPQTQM